MTLLLVLIVAVMLPMIGAAPVWAYAQRWGYWPSVALAVVLLMLMLVLLLLTGWL